ncbi:MAG: hydrogenase maturation nickel metallochaperone HypA [candidate division WOR-3 bacterium]|nr:hydrogenase maturation nickel metallochaperone HypA [candidate division WOR-3 bacterium]
MHEYSITKSIVELCHQEARKHKIGQVKLIRIRLGRFTGFSPAAINFYFDYLKRGTRCENARIEFFEIPIRIKCPACNFTGEIVEPVFICPECGKPDIEIISGREFYVESIEGE